MTDNRAWNLLKNATLMDGFRATSHNAEYTLRLRLALWEILLSQGSVYSDSVRRNAHLRRTFVV